MLHTDSAYAMLSEALQAQEIDIESNEINEREVNATASANGVDITVWFDADSQQFGFNMLTGGSKKYDNLDDFVKYFKTYFDISTELVPKAKVISNVCEEELGITTIYESFKGNKSSGYYVVFRVLSDDKRELRITQDKSNKNLYKAEVILYNEGKTQKKVEHEFLYEMDDEANIRELVTLDSYITGLGRYEEDNNLEIRRIGTYEFVITYFDRDNLHFIIKLDSGKVIYYVKEYNDKEFKPSLEITLKDATDLYGLRDLVSKRVEKKEDKKDISTVDTLLDEAGEVLHGIDEVSVSEGELGAIGEIANSNMDIADELMKEAIQDTEENSAIDEIESEETLNDGETKTEVNEEEIKVDTEELEMSNQENKEEEIISEVSIDTNDISVEYVKLIKTDGRITGVLFITKDVLYKISKDVALELLPINAIEEYTDSTHSKGIAITDEEKSRKKFAKDVSYDKEFCEKLVVALFS